jgi:hypothetical protein
MRSRELAIVAVLGVLASTAPAAAYTGVHPGRPSGSHAGRPSGAYPGRSSGSHAARPSGAYQGRSSGSYAARPSGAYPGRSSGSYAGRPSGAYPGRSSGSYAGRPSGAYPGRSSGSYAARPSGAYPGRSSGSYAARPLGAYPGRYPAGNPGRYPVSYPGHYPGRYPRYYPGRYPGYYPYSSVYWGVGIGWGWGLGQWGWGGGWGPWGWGWGGPWGPWGWGTAVADRTGPEAVAQPDLAAVDTDVSPEHARVILDGQLIGVADDFDGSPDYLYLRPGHYTIEFQLGGYRSEKVEIDAKPGSHFPINLDLQRIEGEKATPWYDRPEGLPVGRVFGPPKGDQEPPARSGPDPTLRLEFRQPSAPAPRAQSATTSAALDLRVTPPNAAVYVDGTMVGTGAELGRLERGLAVAPGKHLIDVVAPGYASKSLEADVKESERQQVVVELDVGAGQNR